MTVREVLNWQIIIKNLQCTPWWDGPHLLTPHLNYLWLSDRKLFSRRELLCCSLPLSLPLKLLLISVAPHLISPHYQEPSLASTCSLSLKLITIFLCETDVMVDSVRRPWWGEIVNGTLLNTPQHLTTLRNTEEQSWQLAHIVTHLTLPGHQRLSEINTHSTPQCPSGWYWHFCLDSDFSGKC